MATELSAAIVSLVKEAFEYGFGSPETYNDTTLNSADEAWAKHEADFVKSAAALASAPAAVPTPLAGASSVRFEIWARDNISQPRFSGRHIRKGAWAYDHPIVDLAWRCWKQSSAQPAPQAGAAETPSSLRAALDELAKAQRLHEGFKNASYGAITPGERTAMKRVQAAWRELDKIAEQPRQDAERYQALRKSVGNPAYCAQSTQFGVRMIHSNALDDACDELIAARAAQAQGEKGKA